MQIIFFSSNNEIIEEWKQRYDIQDSSSCYDLDSLKVEITKNKNDYILICDYDSIAHDINKLISTNNLPKNCIVLEKSPAIITGKSLIYRGIKAYGNSRMLNVHYSQLLETVINGNIWTYPELTTSMVKISKNTQLNDDAKELLKSRLTDKENEVILLVLEGLTNDTIAHSLNITNRTVKAHVSSIFTKLHVNDRISLVLLLK